MLIDSALTEILDLTLVLSSRYHQRVTFEDKDNKGFVTVKPSGPPPPPSKEIFEAYASKTKITTAVGKGGPSGIDKPKDKGKQVVKTDGTDHLAAIRTGVTLKALGDRAKSEEPQGDFMEELRKAQSKRLKKPDPVEGGVLGPIKKSPDLPPPRGPSTSKAGPSSSGLKSAIPGPSSSGGSTIPGPSSSGLGPPPPPTMRIEDWESNKTKKIPLVGKVDLAGDISGTKLNSAQDNKIDKGKQIVKPQDDFMGTLKDNLTRKLKPVSTGEREKPLEKENPTPTSTIVSNQEMLRTALLLASKKVQKGDVDDEIGDDQDDDESEVEKQKPKPEDNKADKVKDNTARDLLKNIVGTMATVEIDDKKEAGIEDETWT
ncbi:hypothetical protein NEOLI_005390 [Neolecta irregularis DAH-3]|uniref:WH2 domain-containing protein n=1 Tax=Neolecta irregularis (strain DAH-3) TaxID=1198029 RepID=A0A1U7LKF6_NEOID|nr:hypothetical protein NEOLI_005390 [Neolecta irregularis DAH-3]|eukprot:OLL23134.1 hypothetical protein NEOLI_005390 [Neolecta irregularis DAH-3]